MNFLYCCMVKVQRFRYNSKQVWFNFWKNKRFSNLIEAETSTVPSTTFSTTLSTIFSSLSSSLSSTSADMNLQRGLKRRKCRGFQHGSIPIYDKFCHGPPIHPLSSKNFHPKNPGAIPNNFKCGKIRKIFIFSSFQSMRALESIWKLI